MKKLTTLAAAAALTASLAACNTPGERAAGGALIGGAAGTAIGAASTRSVGGAVAGGLIGAAGGAIIGSATAPQEPQCPYGVFRGRDGNLYCR